MQKSNNSASVNSKFISKKVATSLNPQKLKEYLLKSQQDPIIQATMPQKASSRNHQGTNEEGGGGP